MPRGCRHPVSRRSPEASWESISPLVGVLQPRGGGRLLTIDLPVPLVRDGGAPVGDRVAFRVALARRSVTRVRRGVTPIGGGGPHGKALVAQVRAPVTAVGLPVALVRPARAHLLVDVALVGLSGTLVGVLPGRAPVALGRVAPPAQSVTHLVRVRPTGPSR